MNYQHAYHAGHFADVFKHTIFIALIQHLQRKEKPFCILDAHAGAGLYDLHSEEAQKSCEYQTGVARILNANFQQPSLIYLQELVKQLNSKEELRYYPGSPWIAKELLRSNDRLILVEKNLEIYQQLKTLLKSDLRVAIHRRDAYESLSALLPPTPRRGVVLIDPPYESKEEFRHIVESLQEAFKRWPEGIFVIWYPIKKNTHLKFFYQRLNQLPCKNIIKAEIHVLPIEHEGLAGCGMAMLNPPWQFERELNEIQQILRVQLATIPGHC